MVVQRELLDRTFNGLVPLFLGMGVYLSKDSESEQYSERESKVFSLLNGLHQVCTDSL